MGNKLRIPAMSAVDELRDMCIKHGYFTCGSSYSYEKMFDLVKAGRPVHDMAIAIWVCSRGDDDIATIEDNIKKAIYKEV